MATTATLRCHPLGGKIKHERMALLIASFHGFDSTEGQHTTYLYHASTCNMQTAVRSLLWAVRNIQRQYTRYFVRRISISLVSKSRRRFKRMGNKSLMGSPSIFGIANKSLTVFEGWQILRVASSFMSHACRRGMHPSYTCMRVGGFISPPPQGTMAIVSAGPLVY